MRLLIIIIGSILSGFTIPISILKLSSDKLNWKSLIKSGIILSFLLAINYIYFEGLLKLIITIFAITIGIYFSIFNRNLAKSLFYSIIYDLFACFSEIIICLIEIVIFNFDVNNYNSSPIFILITTILNIILVYIFCNIKIFKNITQKLYKLVSKKTKIWAYIFFILVLILMLVSFNWYNFDGSLNFYINITLIIFVLITLIYMISNSIQNMKLENKYNQTMEYVQKYEKIINEQGKKNHEYNNQLMVIKGYINNPKKLEEYLDLIVEEHKCGQNYTIRQLSYFPDGGIKGLIYHKIGKMDDEGIKYYLYIDQDIKNIFEDKFDVKTYQDITKLLGVFLDNAIEATIETDPKEIELEIRKEDNTILINICNTYNNSINIKQVGKKGFTTKGIGHGYGLSIVKDIAKHNDKIETVSDIEDNKFKQTIIIYYE